MKNLLLCLVAAMMLAFSNRSNVLKNASSTPTSDTLRCWHWRIDWDTRKSRGFCQDWICSSIKPTRQQILEEIKKQECTDRLRHAKIRDATLSDDNNCNCTSNILKLKTNNK